MEGHMPKGRKKQGREKRVYPRFSTEISVKFRVLNEQNEIESFLERREKEKSAKTRDVSMGGMYIETGYPLKKDYIVQLDILVPGQGWILKAFAQVVWPGGTGGGLKFLMMPEEDKKRLKSFLDKL